MAIPSQAPKGEGVETWRVASNPTSVGMTKRKSSAQTPKWVATKVVVWWNHRSAVRSCGAAPFPYPTTFFIASVDSSIFFCSRTHLPPVTHVVCVSLQSHLSHSHTTSNATATNRVSTLIRVSSSDNNKSDKINYVRKYFSTDWYLSHCRHEL